MGRVLGRASRRNPPLARSWRTLPSAAWDEAGSRPPTPDLVGITPVVRALAALLHALPRLMRVRVVVDRGERVERSYRTSAERLLVGSSPVLDDHVLRREEVRRICDMIRSGVADWAIRDLWRCSYMSVRSLRRAEEADPLGENLLRWQAAFSADLDEVLQRASDGIRRQPLMWGPRCNGSRMTYHVDGHVRRALRGRAATGTGFEVRGRWRERWVELLCPGSGLWVRSRGNDYREAGMAARRLAVDLDGLLGRGDRDGVVRLLSGLGVSCLDAWAAFDYLDVREGRRPRREDLTDVLARHPDVLTGTGGADYRTAPAAVGGWEHLRYAGRGHANRIVRRMALASEAAGRTVAQALESVRGWAPEGRDARTLLRWFVSWVSPRRSRLELGRDAGSGGSVPDDVVAAVGALGGSVVPYPVPLGSLAPFPLPSPPQEPPRPGWRRELEAEARAGPPTRSLSLLIPSPA